MTTFKCRTCGNHWFEGPTRDYNPNEQCRSCVAEGLANTQARVAELEGEVHFLKMHVESDAEVIGQMALKAIKTNLDISFD